MHYRSDPSDESFRHSETVFELVAMRLESEESGRFDSQKVRRWAHRLSRLVQFESVFESEHAVTDFVAGEIGRLGVACFDVPFDPAILSGLPGAQPPISSVPGRRNLVARIPGSGQASSLVINCHLDVVPSGPPEAWRYPPFSGHVDWQENTVHGRGAMDDKAGAAIALAVLEELATGPPPPGDVIVHFVLEDETTGNGSLLCLNAGYGGDEAIILDGTRGDRGIDRHAGNLRFAVEFSGRPASVSVSHMGTNAIERLAELLQEMSGHVFARNASLPPPWTDFPSPNQFITQTFRGEGAPLTVPDHAVAECYVTFCPPESLAGMRAALEAVAQDYAARTSTESARLVWDGYFATEPVAPPRGAVPQMIREIVDRSRWSPVTFGPSTGTSDMRHFADRGIPCVLFGPGRGFHPHRADEHYYLEDLPKMVGLLLDVIARLGAR